MLFQKGNRPMNSKSKHGPCCMYCITLSIQIQLLCHYNVGWLATSACDSDLSTKKGVQPAFDNFHNKLPKTIRRREQWAKRKLWDQSQ